MNCLCDDFRFPPELAITAGLTQLPRQTGTFAEFRRALLHAASIRTTVALEQHPLWSARYLLERDRNGLKRSLEAIGQWRGRHPEDFGVMLVEMWAYVCDLTSFYDDVLAHESYLRTARRRESIRKLVDPIGYIARPAVAALAELAAFAEGRQAVALPAGTAFRSGAFDGNPPQVFELGADATIHPLLNEWSVLPVRRSMFPAAGGWHQTLLCELGTVAVEEGDLVLVLVGTDRTTRTVLGVANHDGADGVRYSEVMLSYPFWIPGGTSVSTVRLLKPTSRTPLWTRTAGAFGPLYENEEATLPYATWFLLESIDTTFRTGHDVIVERNGGFVAGEITETRIQVVSIQGSSTVEIKDAADAVIAKVPVAAVNAKTTGITVEPPLGGVNLPATTIDAAVEVAILHAFVSAGKVTIEALTEIDRTDPLSVRTPVETPRDASMPGTFQLEDRNGAGLTRPGMLSSLSGTFTVQGDPWPDTLVTPVRLFGNVVSASRGETVNGEFLGSGDSAVVNQSFTLKKKPLTYLPAPSESTPSGLTSTLKVYVDGLQWMEVPSFYGRGSQDEIYIVRQNDKNESVVMFGDGVLGRRLNTGASVSAYYRHGGGAAMPPAGSITQIAKPVKGLKGVRSPVAPYGGADAEPADSLQKYAPRSALLLGRAVSLADLEAAAASYSGVRAATAEWRWSSALQVPAAHIWYLADGDLTQLILNQLRSLTQPDTPIQVERALPWAGILEIQLTHDPRRFEEDVLAAARIALMDDETGFLSPERLGIGKPLFRSRLFEFLLGVPGVLSVTGLTLGELPFTDYGVKPPAGRYFDFSNGLYLNGRNE
jgi:hypothetical protein